MNDRKLFGIGAIGTVVAAICCFTPVLVILFAAVGLSAWLLWIDYVLWPLLAVSLAIAAFAGIRLLRRSGRSEIAQGPVA
ncbi:MAG: mercury resistance system transport protein MerF [Alphaproteobacteria bacterium]